MATKIAKDKETKSLEDFEARYEELKQCLNTVKQKDAALYTKIEALEKGVALHKEIKSILDSAELKIEEIKLSMENEED